jgi:hypothetical protein
MKAIAGVVDEDVEVLEAPMCAANILCTARLSATSHGSAAASPPSARSP